MPTLEQNGVTITYESFGNSKHPCVILVMGVTGQLISWSIELVQGLAEKGFYVIRFDNRDVGLSSYYDHLKTPELMEAIALKQQNRDFTPPYVTMGYVRSLE
jgi:pimeloyl-ACP methyl ester carboxylesterase